MATQQPGYTPISPAARKRLQQWFEQGNRSVAKGDFKYALDMFTQCVQGDPANVIYAQNLLGTLHRKYNNNRKGSKLAMIKSAGPQASIKKAEYQKDHAGVISAAIDLLKLNPWNAAALLAIGVACGKLGCEEAELFYLKVAQDAAPKDAAVLQQLATAFEERGQFDSALATLNQLKQQRPKDETIEKQIAALAINKTINKGGYQGAESTRDARKKAGDDDDAPIGPRQKTPEEKLLKAIEKDPSEVSNYRQLADVYLREERFDDAIAALTKGLAASGGDVAIAELIEDLRIRQATEQVVIAERRAKEQKTPEAVALVKQKKAELNKLELDAYAGRCERYPNNPALKYELGLRLKRAGMYQEAIKHLQEARADGKKKASVQLDLGECFHMIKQYKLAMGSYRQAVESVGDRDPELLKLALYRTGKLALGLGDKEEAEKHLTKLAELDFAYRDVPQLLDKLGGGEDT